MKLDYEITSIRRNDDMVPEQDDPPYVDIKAYSQDLDVNIKLNALPPEITSEVTLGDHVIVLIGKDAKSHHAYPVKAAKTPEKVAQ